jgi:uncharacterized protein DUF5710
MLRVDLSVPFTEKSAVRRLGARWDSEARVWFVPADCDPSPFARWLPRPGQPNIRAPRYWIAESAQCCWRCRGVSAVHGFALPKEHQTLWVGERRWERVWETGAEPTLVCYLEYLLPAAVARIRQKSTHYRFGFRRRTRSFYWVNFCQLCGSKLGDYETFCEPGQAFMPLTRDDATRIVLTRVDEPFEATAGGWSLGSDLFEFMTERGRG